MIWFIDAFTVTLNYNQLTINDCIRLAQFLTGLRLSSVLVFLLLWLTWFWFTNDELRTKPYLSAWPLLSSPVSMGNVCCLSVDTGTRSVPSRSPGIDSFIDTCVNFVANLFVSTSLFIVETCLASRCLEMDVSAVLLWLHNCGVQVSCHNILFTLLISPIFCYMP
jgi:hypothetical protein